MNIRRILVPVDFSAGALQGLEYATDLLSAGKAELIVLHVVEPVYYATPADLYGASANLSMLLEEQQRVAAEQLALLARRLKQRRIRVRTVLQTGSPYQIIIETAEKLAVDLIVMATHGRTGLSHLLMGSVAEKVVRAAQCPVLTVRSYAKKVGRTATRRRR
jgi:nucleotide-binding universal stress UspA family protein